jgi:hypothetical protein
VLLLLLLLLLLPPPLAVPRPSINDPWKPQSRMQ